MSKRRSRLADAGNKQSRRDAPLAIVVSSLSTEDKIATARCILKELQRKGKAIIVSSHVLEDLTDLSNKIAVIDQGVLLAFGSTRSLLSRLRDNRRWKIRLRDDDETERLRAFLDTRSEVKEVHYHGDHILVTFTGGDEVTEEIHKAIFREGFRLMEFAEEALGLEELYLRLTGVDS